MNSDKGQPHSIGNKRGPDPMATAYEAVGIRMDRVERNLAELSDRINRLAAIIEAQTASVDRMERGITQLVSGIEAQRQTMADFLRLATQQANTIGILAQQK